MEDTTSTALLSFKIHFVSFFNQSFYALIRTLVEIVVFIGSITNRSSNYLPHDPCYDVLTTTLRKRCSSQRGVMIYEECGDHGGQHCTRSSFLYFSANGSTIQDVFSLKPSATQRQSSLKISAHQGSPFRRS